MENCNFPVQTILEKFFHEKSEERREFIVPILLQLAILHQFHQVF